MLRKRTRSVQKDQNEESQVCDSGSESSLVSDGGGNKNPKNSSFYTTIPGLLVGLTPKGLALDCDSVRSPTSPLEFRFFSGLGNPFKPSSSTTARSVSSSSHDSNGQQRSKLGLVNILDDDEDPAKLSGKAQHPSESSKNIILFGPKLRPRVQNEITDPPSSSPKSVPKNYAVFAHASKPKSPFRKESSDVLFEIRSCSLDSCRTIPSSNKGNVQASTSFPGPIVGSSSSGKDFIGCLSATEIELSEDYTCVISHGSNPKTTHIFGDCILETHSNDLSKSFDTVNNKASPITTNSAHNYPSHDFLSFCDSCNKKLEDGKDIYIYRGEKAFCSLNCRSLEILNDEKLEKENESPDDEDDCNELFFETGLIDSSI